MDKETRVIEVSEEELQTLSSEEAIKLLLTTITGFLLKEKTKDEIVSLVDEAFYLYPKENRLPLVSLLMEIRNHFLGEDDDGNTRDS